MTRTKQIEQKQQKRLDQQRQQVEKLEKLGVSFSHEFKYDDMPDVSWLGELTHEEPIGWTESFKVPYSGQAWRMPEYLWYTPMNSMADSRKWYVEHGYSKHEAYTESRKHAIQDAKRLQEFYNGDWHSISIWVTASYDGSTGQAVVGGYESDSDERFMADEIVTLSLEAADDMISGRMSDKHADSINDVLKRS